MAEETMVKTAMRRMQQNQVIITRGGHVIEAIPKMEIMGTGLQDDHLIEQATELTRTLRIKEDLAVVPRGAVV
jgi:uncharacterized protein with PIN domain